MDCRTVREVILMKRFYKTIENGYLASIGVGYDGDEITKREFDEIMQAIQNRPEAPAGYYYRMLPDLTWELHEAPPEETDPEISDEEALSIILGGETA